MGNVPVWQPDINKEEEERKKREEEQEKEMLEKGENMDGEENGGGKKKGEKSSSSSSEKVKRVRVDRTTSTKEEDEDIESRYKQFMKDYDKKSSPGIISNAKRFVKEKTKKLRGSISITNRSEGPIEICNTLTLVEEIQVQDGSSYNNHKKVKIEELDHFSEEEEEIDEDINYSMDIVETESSRTPLRRRRSSFEEEFYFYDDNGGEEIDESVLYSRRGVVVQFPDDVDDTGGEEDDEGEVKPESNEEVKKSLTEEEQISGNLLVGKLIQTYWNDPANNRVGFYPGVIQNFRIFNNDLQYEVKYESGNLFWEVIDDGVLFQDEILEEVKKKIIEIRKARGTYSMVPIRRKVERSRRRRMSSLTNGRKNKRSQVPQTSRKRKPDNMEYNDIKRRKTSAQ